MRVKVSLEEAQEELLGFATPIGDEFIDLAHAFGRVMAVDVVATQSLPPCIQAAVDGYALHEEDVARPEAYPTRRLTLRQRLKAGETAGHGLAAGETIRVVTGGPVPDFTSAVIAEEQVRLHGNQVFINNIVAPGSNLKAPGEDFTNGEVIARAGTPLTPGLVGVLAAMGQSRVAVYRQPRVAVVSFGGEIVPSWETPDPGQTRDCNGPLLAALVARDGGRITAVEIMRDTDRRADRLLLQNLIDQSDLLLTIGGTANEAGDQALFILRELGARMLFWGVRIKPGSHSGAGIIDDKPVISLSGNPAACSVGYELLAAPVLHNLRGLRLLPVRLTAICTNSFPRGGGPRRFLRGYAVCGQDGWRVAVLPGQKSSMLRSLVGSNALIELPEGHTPVEPGARVTVLLINPAI
ncbi:MAG: gephyrin-like molybdotransferase Glp [Thermacetogeniaceae bacterium]